MDRSGYNAKVKDMQTFCIAAGMEHRIEANASLNLAEFQVFYGGWRTIGWERDPMTPECLRFYDDDADARVRYEVVGDIAR